MNEDKGEIIYCSRCGAEVNSKSRYCMKCGNLNYNHDANENMRPYIQQDSKPYEVGSGEFAVQKKENEYRIKVTGDEQAGALLQSLVANKVNVICFDLSELSLHEIFVKEVGADEK